MSKESFYGLFTFTSMSFCAIDYGITFEDCDIQKNIPELGLKAGKNYYTIYFMFNRQEFFFVVWNTENKFNWTANEQESLHIPQEKLADFLVWPKVD